MTVLDDVLAAAAEITVLKNKAASMDGVVNVAADMQTRISDTIRSSSFLVIGSYLILLGVRDWDAGNTEWDHYPLLFSG